MSLNPSYDEQQDVGEGQAQRDLQNPRRAARAMYVNVHALISVRAVGRVFNPGNSRGSALCQAVEVAFVIEACALLNEFNDAEHAIPGFAIQLRELNGGGVELRLKLSGLLEIERWVLSWGGDAKVLKPKELVDSVRQAAEKILRG